MLRRRTVFRVSVCAICLVAAGGAFAADWPGFRGPHRDGAVPDVKLFSGESATPTIGWKRDLGSGYSAVVVGDGRAVTMFAEGEGDYLAAFDVDSGDELWRYRIADTYNGHDGSHDGPISTPLIADGRVYGLGAWGQLFAVDSATGKEIWKTHLVDDLESKKPHYGFTTSPLIADGVLVVELGAEGGKAVAGFDPADGKLLLTVGDDTFEYHSPIVAKIAGERQVLAAGKDNLFGIEAKTGKLLWSYKHEGDERAMGGMTIVPVPAGEDRVFLMNKIDSSVMLQVSKKGDDYEVAELWSGNGIKQSYVVPVYHDGLLYGMSNRIFTCLDAATGETKWRSREPGDGFPTIVGDHLVMITKPGTLHVADLSSEGYNEIARLDLFDEHSWSEVAFAAGHLYARSMAQLARVDFAGGETARARTSVAAGTRFGGFLDEVAAAQDKAAVVDAFLQRQQTFPIIEDAGLVHFVYRGEAEDVGIVGDMIGFRREDPMTRVPGTDLFYYTTRLEPNAAVAYGFIPDYGDAVADPLNPRPGDGLFGEVSWFSMPAWQEPSFLDEAEAGRRGRLENIEWESEVREGQKRTAQVYLPAGYDGSDDRRYPVLYVHNGLEALEEGRMRNALDQLIGASVEPVIAVFVMANEEDPRADLRDMESYSKMVADELVPLIDERFRTIAESMSRATVGSGRAANVALYSAFEHPDVFRRVAAQAATMGPDSLAEKNLHADELPMVIYLDWGTYHMRSPHEAWDLAVENRKLWNYLREAGYRPAGGESPVGFAWGCWSGRTDELLTALFPRRS